MTDFAVDDAMLKEDTLQQQPTSEMFVVLNIGCLECEVSSNIVGTFTGRERAEAVAAQCQKYYNWREGGRNDFIVLPLPEPECINHEYPNVEIV